ncbi:MAG: BlaI/MecI/CopY family transcriptional regulator [Phycisphaerae bacterium]|nr:BlaI/MecI/CopY family transcriptional regulator [Phycisphaerae bacterium]
MKPNLKISDAEWQIMKVFWSRSPGSATANEVMEALGDKTQWNHRTCKTLISRLVTKKVLGYEQEGRTYHYYPKVSQEECVRAETQSFINRVLDDTKSTLKPMLAAFLEDPQLSKDDIDELKKIIDKKAGK